jgi:hypothetical protein
VALDIVLGCLERFAKSNNGSEQLLAFGLHVRANKTQ